MNDNVTQCVICGRPIKSLACPHPWREPFQNWPRPFLQQAWAVLEHGSPHA